MMNTPDQFNLPNPLSLESHPFPDLPKYLKHQVYEKTDVFAKVDNHAIEVAKYLY